MLKVIRYQDDAMMNIYFVVCEESRACVVVDPGEDAPGIMERLAQEGWDCVAIVITHGHYDHIGAVDELGKKLDVPVMIHREDAWMLTQSEGNLSFLSGKPFDVGKADILLDDGDQIPVGAGMLAVAHTPGHSPGGISLIGEGFVLTGDTLFCGDVGRTDFPYGDFDQLAKGIRQKLYVLPDETMVYPGHDRSTTIGAEKRGNHFVRGEVD